MSAVRAFLRDARGASAAEFAMVLPVFLLFLLGIIDLGRYAWAFNQAEKATQMGARFAVVTNPLPQNMTNYSFVSDAVPQGSSVPQSAFGGVQCKTAANGTTLECSCNEGGVCGFVATDEDTAAWNNLLARMRAMYPGIAPANVVVDYGWSGLGYAGNPNGSDISPLVTVSLRDMAFEPAFLGALGITLPIPSASYSLTMEDGQGVESN